MLMSKRTRWACCIAIVGFAVSRGFAATLDVFPPDPKKPLPVIQMAIDKAKAFDTIIVHEGVYKESINFKAKPITVTSDPNDPNAFKKTIIDGGGANVVSFQSGETGLSVLRGLSVRNGKNGIECIRDSRPLIADCVVYENSAAGIYAGSATIEKCTVHSNKGHGIDYCTGIIRNCTVRGNHAHGVSNFGGTIEDSNIVENDGFGLYAHQGSCSIARCLVSGNGSYGVYWLNTGTNATLKNSIISGNGAKWDVTSADVPSGIYVIGASGAVTNCTVVANTGAGVEVKGAAKVTIGNSIIAWNQKYGIMQALPATSEVTSRYNDVFANQVADYGGGIVPGQGDMREYPWFAVNSYWDKDGWHDGDYHLMSTVGRWDPAARAWVKDPIDSLCLDRGDPNARFLEEPYPNGGRINLGCYGGTAEASMSAGGFTCTQYPQMDFNHDCKVDQADLDLFMEHWLECNLDPNSACWPQGPPAAPNVQP